MLRNKLLAGAAGLAVVLSVSAVDLVRATVNNGHMIEMQKVKPGEDQPSAGVGRCN